MGLQEPDRPLKLLYTPNVFIVSVGSPLSIPAPASEGGVSRARSLEAAAAHLEAAGGTPTVFVVSPELPGGLQLDASNGNISGTPNTVTEKQTYLVSGMLDWLAPAESHSIASGERRGSFFGSSGDHRASG